MKVLFINPSQENIITDSKGWIFGIQDVGYYQPLGILYVASFLKKNISQIDVKVIDAASPDMPYSELEIKIKEYHPDVVGISSYTPTIIDTYKTADIVKKINPECHVNIGGHHVSGFGMESLQHKAIDSVIIGEGERPFTGLISSLINGNPIENTPGIFTKQNIDQIKFFQRKDYYYKDISQLPFPDRNLLKEYKYFNELTLGKKLTTIISSRGCPYACNFCQTGREPYRSRTVEDILNEIEYCIDLGYTDFFFAEDTFNISNEKVRSFCYGIKKRGLKFGWCCKARIQNLNRETLKNMSETGCYLINLGVETGSDSGLKFINKGTSTQKIHQVFSLCKEFKIKSFAYFIIGHPFEKSKKDILKNIDFLISLNADYCNINVLTPYPFTDLFEEGVKKGFLSYASWNLLVLKGKKFTIRNWEEHFSKKELHKLRMFGIAKFYLRPSYILKELVEIRNLKQFIFRFNVFFHMVNGILK